MSDEWAPDLGGGYYPDDRATEVGKMMIGAINSITNALENIFSRLEALEGRGVSDGT